MTNSKFARLWTCMHSQVRNNSGAILRQSSNMPCYCLSPLALEAIKHALANGLPIRPKAQMELKYKACPSTVERSATLVTASSCVVRRRK